MNFVKNQDVSAFEELLERYERRIFTFFYRLMWNTEEARDCTQDTFLQVWKGRIRYTIKGRFSTYIFQIAKNHFLHEHRRHKSKSNLIQNFRANMQKHMEEESVLDSTYGRVIAHEIDSAISEAVASLPEKYRLVYVLSEEQQLSYKEISNVLGCPVGTVSSRKVEAIRKLRKLLEPLRDEVFGKDPQTNNSEVEK